ncbi:MAG: hypothetical protein J6A37_08335 [Oscillospiraceae bacterium]|nr:hypothetical protein [Oscillospiraceae bacterium]
MKIKKLIPMLMCALCMTACADIPPVIEPVPENERLTVTAPADGWTKAELLDVCYPDGMALSDSPCLRDFGAGYGISKMACFELEGVYYYCLIPAENCFSENFYDWNLDISYDTDIKNVTAVTPFKQLKMHSNYYVNGITDSSDLQQVKEKLGEPDKIGENDTSHIYIYNDRETGEKLLEVKEINKKIVSVYIYC